MRASVIIDFRFRGAPDGSVWTKTAYGNGFWQRYRAVYDAVTVVARVEPSAGIPPGWQRVDGNGITVASVPYYLGPLQYVLRRRSIRKAVLSAFHPGDAQIIRAFSILGILLTPMLSRLRYPFALEVGGDPWEAFGPGSVRHPLSPLFRAWFTRVLKRQCRQAKAVAYVTESVLQLRYPCAAYSIGASDVEISDESIIVGPRVFTTSYSNVELREDAFVEAPAAHRYGKVATLVFIGSLAQMYKGPDLLLEAAHECLSRGVELDVVVIGDGKHRGELEGRARDLGISDRVHFLGEISSGSAVRAELDRADIFVLPSRTEGLPRAMVEAMARGLPCIGAAVGGIVELLPPEALVAPGRADALADKIEALVRNPALLDCMSLQNLAKARQYRDEVLSPRRTAFYQHLKRITESRLRASGATVKEGRLA